MVKDFKRTTSWQLCPWAGAIRQFKQFEFNNAVSLWHKENKVESYLGILKGLNRSLEMVFTGEVPADMLCDICFLGGTTFLFLKKCLFQHIT